MLQIEKDRTEAEAVALLEEDRCPICTLPVECCAGMGSPDEDIWFHQCHHCGVETWLHIYQDGKKRVSIHVPAPDSKEEARS